MSGRDEDRMKAYQEHINKRVLIDWVRVVGLDNPKSWRLLNTFARNVLKYPDEKPLPFTWPVAAGFQRGIQAYRARVDYTFWNYFLRDGRKLLFEHNKNEGTKIEINKELTLPMNEEQNLGLLIRKKLREIYSSRNLKPPSMQVKRARLNIGSNISLRSSVAALKIGVKLEEWDKTPIFSMLTNEERLDYKNGTLKIGSVVLPGIEICNDEVISWYKKEAEKTFTENGKCV